MEEQEFEQLLKEELQKKEEELPGFINALKKIREIYPKSSLMVHRTNAVFYNKNPLRLNTQFLSGNVTTLAPEKSFEETVGTIFHLYNFKGPLGYIYVLPEKTKQEIIKNVEKALDVKKIEKEMKLKTGELKLKETSFMDYIFPIITNQQLPHEYMYGKLNVTLNSWKTNPEFKPDFLPKISKEAKKTINNLLSKEIEIMKNPQTRKFSKFFEIKV